MAENCTVKLLTRPIKARWRNKTLRQIVEKRYRRPYLDIPSGVDVSDLIGKTFKVKREGNTLIFELVC